jgi:hypothetical protein
MDKVGRVYEIRSDVSEACPLCNQWIGERSASTSERANHLIQEHGCQLLHVGQETDVGSEGPYQVTVYVLGA